MMQYLIEQFGLIPGWLLGSLAIFLRYLLFAGTAFVVFYILFKQRFFARKIQQSYPKTQHITNELSHSLATAFIWATIGIGIYWLRKNGYTQVYFSLGEYGWAYLFFSFWFLVFLHDAYFYWMHRLIHHPRLFPLLHRVHHLSWNPTPLASLSFHPLEAILEIGIIPMIVLVIPFHPLVLFLFATWSLAFNVLGHLGYEIAPKGFVNHPFWKWFNTPTHHNMHHAKVNYNYGLYFNIWDRLMGTNHPEYEQTFNQIKNRLETTNVSALSGNQITQS